MTTSPVASPIGGLGRTILWVDGVAVILCTITTALRAKYASKKNGKWRWDFIWAVIAWFAVCTAGAFLAYSASHGLGNHTDVLAFKDLFPAAQWSFPVIYAGSIAICLSKFSVVALLLEVVNGTGQKTHRILLYMVAGLFGITTVLQVVFTANECRPYAKIWIASLPGECKLKQAVFYSLYIHAGVGAATDLLLALWPIVMVYDLHMKRSLKIGVCLLIATGCLPGIVSCYRVVLLRDLYKSDDKVYAEGKSLLWATVETGGLIVLGSVPPLRLPLTRAFNAIAALFGMKKDSGTSKTYISRGTYGPTIGGTGEPRVASNINDTMLGGSEKQKHCSLGNDNSSLEKGLVGSGDHQATATSWTKEGQSGADARVVEVSTTRSTESLGFPGRI